MEFFKETGSLSMMRLMSFTCVLAAVSIAVVGIYKGSDLGSLGVLVSSFLIPAFTGKAAQSFTEKSNVEKDN